MIAARPLVDVCPLQPTTTFVSGAPDARLASGRGDWVHQTARRRCDSSQWAVSNPLPFGDERASGTIHVP